MGRMPPTALDLHSAAYAWSIKRKRMLLHGGLVDSKANSKLFEFDPNGKANDGWSDVTTTGDQPGSVFAHCMVPAYKGTKMVLFGGRRRIGQSSGSIYILDLETLSWKRGADVDPSQARYSMTCTAAGDSFVVFGGSSDTNSPKDDMLIYNLKTNQWTDQFYLNTPPPPPPPPTKTTTVATSTISTTASTSIIPSGSGPAPEPEPSGSGPVPEPEPSGSRPVPESEPSGSGPAPEPEPSGSESTPKHTNIAVVVGSVTAALMILSLLFFIYRRYASKKQDISSGQYDRGTYRDKKYKDTERIHSQESLEDRKDSQRRQDFPFEAHHLKIILICICFKNNNMYTRGILNGIQP
ncbi:hypothetical protein BG011_009082 [Mortierella polycephala]|uniref:Galactose oxidase n=1 Tax=Mortierella polycephala TaxID=41804 RepID=A0A9P6U6Z6_9FUNG|nr:hypothetical protein BG011_009082 [Mortierella polycephala]